MKVNVKKMEFNYQIAIGVIKNFFCKNISSFIHLERKTYFMPLISLHKACD